MDHKNRANPYRPGGIVEMGRNKPFSQGFRAMARP